MTLLSPSDTTRPSVVTTQCADSAASRRGRAFFCAVSICLIALFTFTLSCPSIARAASKKAQANQHRSNASAARKKAADADRQAAQLRKQVKDLDAQANNAAAKAEALSPQVNAARTKAETLEGEAAKLRAREAALQSELTSLTAEYRDQQKQLGIRAVESYKNGDTYLLEVLFSASDMRDFITRTEMLSRLMRANSDASAELLTSRSKLEHKKAELHETVTAANNKAAAATSERRRVTSLQAQHRNAAQSAQTAQSQKSALMKDAEKNADKLRALAEEEEAEAAKLSSELKETASSGGGSYNGSMTWPVPASHRITSNFGYRQCPFHGRELHPGIDIGAPSGSAIVASGSGKVIYAGWRGGYGNTIIIDHGDGVTSLYGHQRSGGIRVSTGQHVKAGQRIGTVGSTGNSTGPHLHWEVRVNGSPRNPQSF